MSQSPVDSELPDREGEYFQNWNALGELIKRGSSFSGRERNCVFLNTGGPRFADVSAVVGLDYQDDGRCVGLLDWDLDGDLDLWLVNRTAPRVRLLRNDWANVNRHVSIRLMGTSCNRDAIGARVEVEFDDGRRLMDTVRAGDGFLTQSTRWLHFGAGQQPRIRKLKIRWPGTKDWEQHQDLATNARYEIVQGTGAVQEVSATPMNLAASTPQIPASSQTSRVVLTGRVPVTETSYRDFQGVARSLSDHRSKPLLLSFWASWCTPCLEELGDLSKRAADFKEAGLTYLPLCVDGLQDDAGDLGKAQQLLQKLQLTSTAGAATAELTAGFTDLLSRTFYRQRPLPLPCSFLLDADGQLAVIYRGAITADQVINDLQLLERSSQELLASEFPGTGRFLFPQPGIDPLLLVRAYREGGYYLDAKRMLVESIEEAQQRLAPRRLLVTFFRELSVVEAALGNEAGVVEACREAVKLQPDDPALQIALAVALANQGDREAATEQLENVSESSRDDVNVQQMAGNAWLAMTDMPRAAKCFARVVQQRPEDVKTRFRLATCLQVQGSLRQAIQQLDEVLARDPTHWAAANNLAWILATSKEDSLRNGQRAVQLAETVCRATDDRVPLYVGTLSAAYAEVSDFERAVETAERAVQLAISKGQRDLGVKLQERLELHKQNKPYRGR